MSMDENKRTARHAYEARVRGDWDPFYALFDECAELDQAPSLPYGGTFHGIREIRRGMDQMLRAWDFVDCSIERVTGGGDIVISYLHFNVFRKQTGLLYGFPLVELSRFRAGKIIELRPFHWDTHRVNQVFGPKQ
jgi:ketosteroid isomerase-like protein